MKLIPSLTAILLIWITLNVVRPDDPLNKCEDTVNYYRKKAGLRELKEDKQARAGLFEKVYKTCLTEDQVKNGIDGFTVARFTEWDTIEEDFVPPKSIFFTSSTIPTRNTKIKLVLNKHLASALNMVSYHTQDIDKCQNAVNQIRKDAGLDKLKEDQQENARLRKKFIPGTKHCPTKDQLENGVDGFTVTKIKNKDIVPNKNSILSHNVKTFACLELDCKDHHDVLFAFIKNEVAGYSIGKWFLMGAILTIYKLF
ncbi:unnamed protein product [Caenorhabditis nigoni]